MDGLASVEVLIIRGNVTTAVPIDNALQQPIDKRLTSYQGVQIQGDETVWNIPAVELNQADPDIEIHHGDEITVRGGVSDVVYNVVATKRTTLGTRWECVCRKKFS